MVTGYEIDEREFVSLFGDRRTAARLRRALRDWQLELDLSDPESVRATHAAVQREPARQRAVYQIAMDLWR
jgi:hypothetical protein